MIKRVVLLWLTVWALLAGLWWLSGSPWLRILSNPELAASVARYLEVADLAQSVYVSPEKSSYGKLTDAALRGLPGALDDYCEYYNAAEFEAFEKESRNIVLGIGVRMSEVDGEPVVVRVFSGTPASEAGLRAGDRLTGVGLASVEGKGWEGAHRALAECGLEAVEVSWFRPSTGERISRHMERKELTAPTVFRFPAAGAAVSYLELNHFTERTAAELSLALRDAEREGAKAVVLDLRGNPGGLLEAAVDVAGIFLPPGSKVLSVQGRPGDEPEIHLCSRQFAEWKGSVVLLLDGESASASEVVAAALQDHGRAVVVGGRSFGKGSVQTVFPLSDGGGLRITVAHYTSPKGRVIQGKGVEPDVTLEGLGKSTLLQREAWAWKPEERLSVFGKVIEADPVVAEALVKATSVVAEKRLENAEQKSR